MTNRVNITEEVPNVDSYRWIVSGLELHKRDPRRRLFYEGGRLCCGRFRQRLFGTLDAAKVWCADHGLHWRVQPFDY